MSTKIFINSAALKSEADVLLGPVSVGRNPGGGGGAHFDLSSLML